jgi:serine/threonine protein kinase
MLSEKEANGPEEELPAQEEVATEEVYEEVVEEIAESEETVPAEPELMATIPAEDEPSGRLVESCPACGSLMDVTDQAPFAKIFCPTCGQNLRARRQFNNYQLIEQLGEGGMGAVFKALDCNLQRHVALKILKRECSANAEEQAKLEQEARITASVNHPHVVKIFGFGKAHGQFYLAMELVEKGTLDQLMGLQRRVAEAQVLAVGIQIAEGLEAAFEKGLIHRDIKPGNILFADSHTAKLVDFGLAVVMDEVAAASGEIWGTPYYIAPEKLDGLPEDFRSDIYSLGGTLFHALAGRPPYEAETASMVALKQLKSQPISLQAFAPDISSETAYVINRMLAKDPQDRYASYRELCDHLSYARHKLIERSQKPQQPKARVVMETQANRNLTAYLSLGLLATLIIVGVSLYVFRDKIFNDPNAAATAASTTSYNKEEAVSMLKQGIEAMNQHQPEEAAAEFKRISEIPGIVQPMKAWAQMNHALALLAADNREEASQIYESLRTAPFTTESDLAPLATFFVEAAKNLDTPTKPIPSAIERIYSKENFEAFAILSFAVHNWGLSKFESASELFDAFNKAKVVGGDSWIDGYKPMAQSYLADYALLAPLEESFAAANSPAAAQALLPQVTDARQKVTTGSIILARLDSMEATLKAKGAKAP